MDANERDALIFFAGLLAFVVGLIAIVGTVAVKVIHYLNT